MRGNGGKWAEMGENGGKWGKMGGNGGKWGKMGPIFPWCLRGLGDFGFGCLGALHCEASHTSADREPPAEVAPFEREGVVSFLCTAAPSYVGQSDADREAVRQMNEELEVQQQRFKERMSDKLEEAFKRFDREGKGFLKTQQLESLIKEVFPSFKPSMVLV